MEWQGTWEGPFTTYVRDFDELIGDKRTGVTFVETVKGIIGAGSLTCRRIAAYSPALGAVKGGAQRVIRFVTGESTQRSQIDAQRLKERLRQRTSGSPKGIADGEQGSGLAERANGCDLDHGSWA